MIPSFDHDIPHPAEFAGGVKAVLAVLGPDRSAVEWAERLDVSPDAVRALADTMNTVLAWEPPRVGHRERDVLDSLHRLRQATARDVAEHCGIDHGNGWHVLDALRGKGLAFHVGTVARKGNPETTVWALTELGKQVLHQEIAEGREPGVREVACA